MKLSNNPGATWVTVASGFLSVASLVSMLRTPEHRPVLLNFFVASVSVSVTSKLLNDSIKMFYDHEFETINNTVESTLKTNDLLVKDSQNSLIQVVADNQKLITSVSLFEKTNGKLSESLKITHLQVKRLEIRNKELTEELKIREHEKDCRYRQDLENLKNQLQRLMKIRVLEVCQKIEKAVRIQIEKMKMSESVKQLQEFPKRIARTKQECDDLLIQFDEISSESLSEIVTLVNAIHHELTLIETRWWQLKNIDERLALLHLNQSQQNSIPKEKASQYLNQYAATSQEQLEKCFKSVDNNDNEQKDLVKQVDDLLEQLEKKNLELANLRKPRKWFNASRQDLVIGNTIIDFFTSQGIVLDRVKTDFDYWQSTLSFISDRTGRTVLSSELEPFSERLQQLCHTLSPIKFGWNADEGLMTAWLHLSKKPTKPISETDINKIWKTSEKFQTIVKNWSRVRLTGGSESGKSPTAENLAVCILLIRGGTAELYNPQADSVKNYWTIPQVGSSHEDSVFGIETLAAMVNEKTGDRSKFKMTIFDEIDSTMVSVEKKEQSLIGQNISTIIKQFSHQNLGVIFIGQNANASKYPGMDRSDWNSSINVHIGANSYDAITNSNQITKDEQTRLKLQADKLTEFCDEKNSELGLEKTNHQAYRFALVLNDGKPYFIQLPDFGTYTYDLVESALKCPKCDSSNHISNGKRRRKCKDCNHVFSI